VDVRRVCAVLGAAALGLSALARGEFADALKDYSAGHYEAARAQFESLAQLGDCPSQFNLGAMALKGQGGAKDRGAGVGWLEAALSNGCREQVGDRIPALLGSLNPEEARAASAILARYGYDALQAQGVLAPNFECRDQVPPTVIETPAPEYPRLSGGQAPEAIVVTALTVGTDGFARDPEVLLAVPKSAFAAAAVEAWLNSRFAPATRRGVPVESRLQAKLRFVGATGNLASAPTYQAALPAAEANDPASQYLVGLTANLDPSLGVTLARAGQMLMSAARAGNPAAQYWVATQVAAAAPCHPQANASVWLQHAAEGGSGSAAVVEAEQLLRASPAEAAVAQARGLLARAAATDSYYARKHAVALLATSPVEAVHDAPLALKVAQQLLAGEIQSDPQMFEAVAGAYAVNKDFREASAQQRVAISKAQALGWNTAALQRRLSAYRAERAWTGDLFAAPGVEN
jgi:TPR repeat protein